MSDREVVQARLLTTSRKRPTPRVALFTVGFDPQTHIIGGDAVLSGRISSFVRKHKRDYVVLVRVCTPGPNLSDSATAPSLSAPSAFGLSELSAEKSNTGVGFGSFSVDGEMLEDVLKRCRVQKVHVVGPASDVADFLSDCPVRVTVLSDLVGGYTPGMDALSNVSARLSSSVFSQNRDTFYGA